MREGPDPVGPVAEHQDDAEPAGPPGEVASSLALGTQAVVMDGDLHTGRQLFEKAYRLAETAGDAQSMAVAALGFGGLWVHEHRTVARSVLLQSRLRHAVSLLDPDSSLALRLRIRLAGEIDYRNSEYSAILAVLEEARAAKSPLARAEALSLTHHCLLGPEHAALRRELAVELVGESFRTARRSDLLMGLLWQTVDLFLDGDPHAERCLAELRELLAERDHLAIGYVVSAIDVMLAIRSGRLDEAEALAGACAERGATAGDADTTVWHAAQLVTIRWYQGRLVELLPLLNDMVNSPTLSAVDDHCLAALAVTAARAGDRRKAAGALATLCGRDLADLPRSSSWLVTMHGIVEAAHLLDDADTAARAYQLLLPFADLPMVGSLGVACLGSTQQALGLALSTTGDLDGAVEHLRAAVRQNLALAHWPAAMISRYRLGQALRRRDRGSDAETARLEIDTATGEAVAMGIPVPGGSGQEDAPRTEVSCTRQGQRWRIDFGRHSALVKHSIGMFHLAVLIANPGQEIQAADLVAGLTVLGNAAERTSASAQPKLDRVALQEYRRRLTRLRAEIDELESSGEHERAARARTEHDWLVTELAGASGLGGRPRLFPEGGERARIAVGKAIRRALQRIAEADAVIGDHLRRTVHTGARCSYWPV